MNDERTHFICHKCSIGKTCCKHCCDKKKLKIVGGDFKLEYDEQLMSIKFIKPKARVLEIGANIGRNTLVISSLLESSENLITLETDPISADFLTKNSDKNSKAY